MDASDIIKLRKNKTVFYNLSTTISTITIRNIPFQPILTQAVYKFPNYRIRQDYFSGKRNVENPSDININP
jgi:hypothetical protein